MPCDYSSRSRGRVRELQRLLEILCLKFGKVVEKLLRRPPIGHHVHDRRDRHAQVADDGNAAHLPRIDLDSLELHGPRLALASRRERAIRLVLRR